MNNDSVTLTMENFERLKQSQKEKYEDIVKIRKEIQTLIPKGMYMIIDLKGGCLVENPLNPYSTGIRIPKITFKKKTKLYKELKKQNRVLHAQVKFLQEEKEAPTVYKHLFFNIFKKVL